MRSVRWADSALDDFDAAVGFIAERNPQAARRVAAAIRGAASGLSEMLTGQLGRVGGTYERVVLGLPYVIAYALETTADGDERVVIVHVIHTSRDWPPGRWPK
jgi:plasmid stabilization system protein ParE